MFRARFAFLSVHAFMKFFLALLCFSALASRLWAQGHSATEWIDPDTGHRVFQLSTEPGSESLYFNLNPFTPDGKLFSSDGGDDKMVAHADNGKMALFITPRSAERPLRRTG